ncbi:MAG: hypothetical protein HY360_02830, partial [Verrucomicrobia bacterium]|nr:hypothetical protein [Verrucomicrobiota bacterium]
LNEPPPAPKLRIQTVAGGMTNRHEFVRGEEVAIEVVVNPALKASAARFELNDVAALLRSADASQKKKDPRFAEARLHSEQLTLADHKAAFTLDTAPYADGSYQLAITALADGKPVETATETIGIRYLPPESFNWEMWQSAGSNPLRANMEFADIAAAGLELYLVEVNAAGVDAAVRHHLGFSLRAHPDFLMGKPVTFDANPEYFRLDNHGKPFGTAGTGGRPSLNLSHPEICANAVKSMETAVRTVARLPSFRPYVLCNDDFSMFYGWDYSLRVLDAFKKETGLDAPRAMIKPEKFGAIPDHQPWVKWFEWTLINVNGGFNKAETEGVVQARADARIGPIPGGMQIPLVQLWEPAQYPPYNFGVNGFNLICSYYYNTYWQPVMTSTFWMEIGRMGNRDLPQWNMPDTFMTAGYTRNNLFHYLAGGVKGLAYFTYSTRNSHTWPEFKRLGQIVRRIGPVQARLVPARRDIGMLNSFTSNCFDPGHTLIQVYGYHNLMQGHFDVEMVWEDEILAGRATQYKAILLYNVQYLRQPVYDALAKHAAGGGLVILDRTIPFDIPGAKRINVDIGMGAENTKPFTVEGAHLSTPGIQDYGHADRIEIIKKALAQHIKPRFDSGDIKLVATRFEADGVPYMWFVNVHDGKEYMFCRENSVAHMGGGTPEKIKKVRDWEAAEAAKGPYVSAIVMDSLPGVPYDLVTGRMLPVTKTKDQRQSLTLSMERFGGALVAWLPEPITSLNLDAPKRAKPFELVRVTATVLCGRKLFWGRKPALGALPVSFVLKDPGGAESVISGVRATKDGQAVFEWTPAVNDKPGKWTVIATDLAIERRTERAIKLSR